MAKQSTIKKNWPKYVLQWGVLAAIAGFLLIPCKNPANPEAYCPMGGLQALTTFFVRGSLPCSMSMVQIVMGIILAAASCFSANFSADISVLWEQCRISL